MSEQRTKHLRLLPWHSEPLGLRVEITSAILDDDRPAVLEVERQLIDVTEPFDRLALHVKVVVGSGVRARVAEANARLGVLLRWRSDETRLRAGKTLELGVGQDAAETTIQLRRETLAGSAELSAELVRLEASENSAPLASRRFARLAGARAWEIRVDRKRELGGVYLDVRFSDFSKDGTAPAESQDELYRLEADSDAPVLWVNSKHEQVVIAMNSIANSGRAAKVREVLFDLIGPPVWLLLFMRAAFALRDGEELTWPWQEAVVMQVGRLLFGSRASFEDLQPRLIVALDDVPGFIARVDGVLQRHHGVLLHAARLAEDSL